MLNEMDEKLIFGYIHDQISEYIITIPNQVAEYARGLNESISVPNTAKESAVEIKQHVLQNGLDPMCVPDNFKYQSRESHWLCLAQIISMQRSARIEYMMEAKIQWHLQQERVNTVQKPSF